MRWIMASKVDALFAKADQVELRVFGDTDGVTLTYSDATTQQIDEVILDEIPVDDFGEFRGYRYEIKLLTGATTQAVDEDTTFTFTDGREFYFTGNSYQDSTFTVYSVDKSWTLKWSG